MLLLSLRCRRNGILLLSPSSQFRGLLSLYSSTAAKSGDASPKPNLVQYLVSSCGFSAAEASGVSKRLPYLHSAEKPVAVVNFMRSQGFDDAILRKMIVGKPSFLCWSVEKNLAPKFRSLRELGISESELVRVIGLNSRIIDCSLHEPKLEMLENLFGSRELLLKHLKKNTRFFGCSIDKKISPNIKFLEDECGIPKERISLVVGKNPNIISLKTDKLRALAVRVEEMGIPRESKMFLWMLYVLCMVSKEKLGALLKIMRKFGWSDDEFNTAITRQPTFLCLSREVLQKRMDFFVKDVGCMPSYIAQRPIILTFSMEKRVLPRLQVIEKLKAKGLWNGQVQLQLVSILSISDAKFFQRFVHPYEENSPKLVDLYVKKDDPNI